jgi:hypothetical protein
MATVTEQAERNKGGAAKGNAHRTRSGKRAWQAVKRLPKGAGLVRRALYAERDEIERAVVSQHGEISLYHAALIQSALRHSGRAGLLERWLRLEEGLSLTERLAVLKEIGSASDSRDRCLKLAGLDVKPSGGLWDALEPGWQPSGAGLHEVSTAGGPSA